MIKSISYWSLQNGLEGTGPIEESLLQAKSHNFKGVELAIAETGVLTPGSDEATCRRYRSLGEKHGMAIETLASGMTWGCSPSDLDPAVRRKSIDLHKAAIQRAAWLGAKSMLFIPGAIRIPWVPTYKQVPYQQALEWARHAVQALAPIAQQNKIELCLEIVWNGMFYSPVEFAAFVDSFQSDWVGVYFDVGNVMGFEQDPAHWIDYLGKRIRRVHLKDFKRDLRNMSGFCDLLAGDVNWPEVMKSLKAIHYNKTLVAEMIPADDAILAKTSAALDKIMSL
ncbi:MAG: sugar phosphate isomerase/epimerase [Phycisphaerales bacterium]|nr:sugar phosphate isomerase/epimerase [Phycisphaerales bacterium]